MKETTRSFILESRFGMTAEELHIFAREHALVISNDIIYTYIPKNACTPLRVAAGKANGFSGDLNNIQKLICATREQVQKAKYTFTFLRNPFDRLASMFLDKALQEPARFHCLKKPHERIVTDKLLRPRHKDNIDSWSFRTFVNRLSLGGHLMRDHHWAPQTAFMLYREYDEYFDVKHASAAFENLSSFLPIEDTREASGHTTLGKTRIPGTFPDTTVRELRKLKASGKLPDYESMYDSDLREKVLEIYQPDFKLYFDKFRRL